MILFVAEFIVVCGSPLPGHPVGTRECCPAMIHAHRNLAKDDPDRKLVDRFIVTHCPHIKINGEYVPL